MNLSQTLDAGETLLDAAQSLVADIATQIPLAATLPPVVPATDASNATSAAPGDKKRNSTSSALAKVGGAALVGGVAGAALLGTALYALSRSNLS